MSYSQDVAEQYKIRVWSSDVPLELKVGQYSWPFRFTFPAEDPMPTMSFRDLCYVWWSLQAFILPIELSEIEVLHTKELKYLMKKGLSSPPNIIHVCFLFFLF